MRRIASELDVEAASLYTHVRNKDAIVDGVLDLVLDEVALPPADLPWRPAITAGWTHYRAALLAHPEAVPLLTERAARSPSQLRLVERSISLLESSGLSTPFAVQAHVALVAFTLGFVFQEVGRSPGVAPELLQSNPVVRRAISALLEVPVDDRFPSRAGLHPRWRRVSAPDAARSRTKPPPISVHLGSFGPQSACRRRHPA
jgi:AcrR family transcriptional regulator